MKQCSVAKFQPSQTEPNSKNLENVDKESIPISKSESNGILSIKPNPSCEQPTPTAILEQVLDHQINIASNPTISKASTADTTTDGSGEAANSDLEAKIDTEQSKQLADTKNGNVKRSAVAMGASQPVTLKQVKPSGRIRRSSSRSTTRPNYKDYESDDGDDVKPMDKVVTPVSRSEGQLEKSLNEDLPKVDNILVKPSEKSVKENHLEKVSTKTDTTKSPPEKELSPPENGTISTKTELIPPVNPFRPIIEAGTKNNDCLLYTSDAADE